MLLLAGLAYYQVLPDPTRGEEGSLVGTALNNSHKDEDINCDNTANLNEEEAKFCASEYLPDDKN